MPHDLTLNRVAKTRRRAAGRSASNREGRALPRSRRHAFLGHSDQSHCRNAVLKDYSPPATGTSELLFFEVCRGSSCCTFSVLLLIITKGSGCDEESSKIEIREAESQSAALCTLKICRHTTGSRVLLSDSAVKPGNTMNKPQTSHNSLGIAPFCRRRAVALTGGDCG